MQNRSPEDPDGTDRRHRLALLALFLLATVSVGLFVLLVFDPTTDSESGSTAGSPAALARFVSPGVDSPGITSSNRQRAGIWDLWRTAGPSTRIEPGTRQPIRLSVDPPEASYPLGHNSVFFVNMEGPAAPSRGTITLSYDPSVLEVKGVRSSGHAASFQVMPQIENASGWAVVNLASSVTGQEVTRQRGLFAVDFVGISTGHSAIVLTWAAFTDAKGAFVPVQVTNGKVEVADY